MITVTALPEPVLFKETNKLYRKEKPWGYEIIWAQNTGTSGYIARHLHIIKGRQLPLQYHEEKEEAIYVISGSLLFITKGTVSKPKKHEIAEILKAGDSREIPVGLIHRLAAGTRSVDLIKISTKHLDTGVTVQGSYERE